MRNVVLPAVAVAGLLVSGCATKKYVGREVGEVNEKVDALSAEVEKTQERVQRNETRISEVDKQAQAGISDAKGSAASSSTR
jgi:outer membrane murein-binding lipoprotein Lpp